VDSQFPGKVNGSKYDKDCKRYLDYSRDFPDPKNVAAAGQEQEITAASRALIILGFRYQGEQTLTPDSLKCSHLAGGTRPSGMGPNYIIFQFQCKTSLGVNIHRRGGTWSGQGEDAEKKLFSFF
jgi:hypothetical protein